MTGAILSAICRCIKVLLEMPRAWASPGHGLAISDTSPSFTSSPQLFSPK
jgi:hypothetical protein